MCPWRSFVQFLLGKDTVTQLIFEGDYVGGFGWDLKNAKLNSRQYISLNKAYREYNQNQPI